MSEPPFWAPAGIDAERPSAARMYDYFLGGSHNFAVDREFAERVLAAAPEGVHVARANRAFLRRAVRYCVGEGIRQLLDIGSGIPTLGNVHEIAQQAAPDARVAYVDLDPVAVEHSRHLLAGNELATSVQADLRDPEAILADPEVVRLIDLSRPVAVLVVAVFHFLSDDAEVTRILTTLGDRVAPGSLLVISHGTDEDWPDGAEKITEVYRTAANPLTARSREQVRRMFDGWTLVDPGVVPCPDWRPEPGAEDDGPPIRGSLLAGVGRKE
jgi:O-methyltransferase involved in polyketide biosynthesis